MKRTFLLLFLTIAIPTPAAAQQVIESVGARALGMAGAFVGVADDASAVLWNPAGLASGQPFGATIEWDRFQFGKSDHAPREGLFRRTGRFGSLGTWPLGLSYGTFRTTAIVTGADDGLHVHSLSNSYYGVTFVQTLIEGIVGGTTVKYVRGDATSGPIIGVTAGDVLDRASKLEGDRRGTIDFDIGLMADMRRVRVGYTMRNLREPEFTSAAGIAIPLRRQQRMGLAILPTDGLTLAMDLDLDTADLYGGLRRMMAFGGETRLGPRAAVRAGVRWSLKGERHPTTSAGASVAVRPGMWLDGYYSHGRDGEDRGFGIALRAGG